MLIGHFRPGPSLLLAKYDKKLNKNLLFDLFSNWLGRKADIVAHYLFNLYVAI